ncbi:PREDICTED: bifunctional lysine-specific demethylase and histidyl-hydroxylase NO66 isoform X1 [Branchiostoma belcheri]|uniref:Bifunctional lysine-specific demethylase and histidyl-hydroxylase n=2 Tax=Branchiostoma belcheri TaxID=7741 RepID=A0A6P5AP72_BRABE|nr:PREDICTED: bifunctional lysine-specific demethylase and histidyl-hydroxylase NO66 isoform X1 [Branchiostoma belcheri]
MAQNIPAKRQSAFGVFVKSKAKGPTVQQIGVTKTPKTPLKMRRLSLRKSTRKIKQALKGKSGSQPVATHRDMPVSQNTGQGEDGVKLKGYKMKTSPTTTTTRVQQPQHTGGAEENSLGKSNFKGSQNVKPELKISARIPQKRKPPGMEEDSDDKTPVKKVRSNTAKSVQSPAKAVDIGEVENSTEEGEKMFEWLIHPVKKEKFFSELWEKKPLLVKRHLESYNDGWFSTEDLTKILHENDIQFGRNLDVTTYEGGQRETHNPPGRAYPAVVWDYYQNGCSVRLLNPQTYSQGVWRLCSSLQEYFSSMVGANIYLTPPGTQGFAPHYDDIEAFVLQLEGKKHWKLYSPRNDAEKLPRFSSDNFRQEEIGEAILDVTLEPGDLLYFPRGTIHQASALPDTHSLHITVSTCQRNTWGDLMEKLVPAALTMAFSEDVEFRQALPRDYLDYMGLANADLDDPRRKAFLGTVQSLLARLVNYVPVDAGVDQKAVEFMHDCLPPVFTRKERACSIYGCRTRLERGRVVGSVDLKTSTSVKLVRKGAARLVMEGEQVFLYHVLENARVYHGAELQPIEIPPDAAPAVEYLMHSYPAYVTIDSFPLDLQQDKVDLAMLMFEKGIIIAQEPVSVDN